MRSKWTAETCELVCQMHRDGHSWAHIEELTGVPRQTAWSMVNYYGRPRPASHRELTVERPVPPEPPVVIGPPAARVESGPSALVNVLDMAALWVRAAADKMQTEKVHAVDRKALARLEEAWAGLRKE